LPFAAASPLASRTAGAHTFSWNAACRTGPPFWLRNTHASPERSPTCPLSTSTVSGASAIVRRDFRVFGGPLTLPRCHALRTDSCASPTARSRTRSAVISPQRSPVENIAATSGCQCGVTKSKNRAYSLWSRNVIGSDSDSGSLVLAHGFASRYRGTALASVAERKPCLFLIVLAFPGRPFTHAATASSVIWSTGVL